MTPLILHRYSISTPYQVHRFDGVTMEMRWSNDGVSSLFLPRMILFFTEEDGNLCNNIIIIMSVLRLGEPCEQF